METMSKTRALRKLCCPTSPARRLFPLAVILVLLALTQLAHLVRAEPAHQVVTLNLGFLQAPGTPGDYGVRLAVDQINRAGGIVGPDGTRYGLQIIYPATPPFIPEDVPAALRFLTSQGVIAIIGPSDNRLALPNLEPLARAGVPC
jgi:hypothetical protein